MSVLDTLKSRMELNSFETKTIGTVYYYPMTGREQDRIGFSDSNIKLTKKLVTTVLLKSLDSSGERLFKDSDENALLNDISMEDISEIANGILAVKSVDEQLGE